MQPNVDIEIRADINLVIVRPRGPMSIDSPVQWLSPLRDEPGFHVGMHQIFDVSNVDVSALTINELRTIVAHIKQRKAASGALIAYVASDDLHYGLLRVFDVLAEFEWPRERRVFRSVDEAIAWVTE